MARKPTSAARAAHSERARLRAAVLNLGGFLGWQTHDVISFTEALTGRPWHRCDCADLEAVLEEYQTLIQVIETKAARRTACQGPALPAATPVLGEAGGYRAAGD